MSQLIIIKKLKRHFSELKFRLFGARDFDKILLRSYQSKVYGEFCAKGHGRDLCQLNAVDDEQLQKLLSELKLNSSHRVLDLGCGVGKISEYISDITGAHVTGVDYARKSIKAAQERTLGKKDRLSFILGDLNALPKKIGMFDCVLAVDTLYFVKDLESSIRKINSLLKPKGQFAAFYSCKIADGGDVSQIQPDTNKLAKALSSCGLKYQTWSFSSSQEKLWNSYLSVAEELKSNFQQEGTIDLCESRIKESQRHLKDISENRAARYMYHSTHKE